MGTSTTTAQFVGKIRHAGANLAKVPVEGAKSNARIAEAALGAAVTAMSGDGVLSRVGRNGARVGVRTRLIGPGRVAVVPKGPVWLVENPTSAHVIGAGRSSLSAGRGGTKIAGLGGRHYNLGGNRTPMHVGGDQWRLGPFIHPGKGGKRQWAATRDGPLSAAVGRSTTVAALRAVGSVFG